MAMEKQQPVNEAYRTVAELVDDLGASDVVIRRRAREDLEGIGEPALDPLLDVLARGEFHLRWEAAKTLAQMAPAAAVPGLIAAVEDEEQDVRWLAAVGLARIGRPALRPLLEALVARTDSPYVRQGVSHFLALYRDEELQPDLSHLHDALGPAENAASAVVAAEKVLRKL